MLILIIIISVRFSADLKALWLSKYGQAILYYLNQQLKAAYLMNEEMLFVLNTVRSDANKSGK